MRLKLSILTYFFDHGLMLLKINKAWVHPDSTNLYCEEIDVGESEPRSIASGLQGLVPLADLQGRMVVICANLKPRSLG